MSANLLLVILSLIVRWLLILLFGAMLLAIVTALAEARARQRAREEGYADA